MNALAFLYTPQRGNQFCSSSDKVNLLVDGPPNMEATYRYIPIVESRKKEQKQPQDLPWKLKMMTSKRYLPFQGRNSQSLNCRGLIVMDMNNMHWTIYGLCCHEILGCLDSLARYLTTRNVGQRDTVDGGNPAPVEMVNIPVFIGFYTSQVVGNGISEPSTVAITWSSRNQMLGPSLCELKNGGNANSGPPGSASSPKSARSLVKKVVPIGSFGLVYLPTWKP